MCYEEAFNNCHAVRIMVTSLVSPPHSRRHKIDKQMSKQGCYCHGAVHISTWCTLKSCAIDGLLLYLSILCILTS